ncbi:restriction endonuclease subunit S [Escherichia coli]|uniref:Type I restriction enzyme EcoDI specificity subunit n=2 Tax=Escherichia coli TaxID=562 RepID=T1SD_ECOLX|nr:restriction endonuclease subunit S [Escherichia coli]P06991.1 RecName: Full=Type I restriction enzyme EcoDI specificity subunit; Short=S protein; AltName: Full=Type I specificity subunit S.EcoDI; Short=S.EcoDI; AltName: Full=Type-1 restriction enzyme EcoDI specificity subunit [Escherichia coli]EEW8178161.1 restriction endonuclease subunit S [Escherichia coli]EEY9925730.1 restriction endonuclease subunit S [Escherichia coli]EFA4472744.1 restriction endonuclease subunit S [Escherichia coli]EF
MSAGKLPVDWKTVELGELIKLSTGKLDANAADNDGQYPFFTCAESVSQINSWAFDTSAVLLAGNGSFSIKKYTGKFNAYQRTYVIEPILIKTEFLYWLLRGNIKKITENGRGSTIPYIRKGDITDISVALPSPSEQTLIAEKLDTLLAQVESTKARLEQIPQILKRFRQAVLTFAMNGELTKEWRSQNNNPAFFPAEKNSLKQFRNKELPSIPNNWSWMRFDQVADIASKLKSPLDYPNTIHLAPNHIESWTGKASGYQTILEDGVTSAKHEFYTGQIIYSKIRPYLCKVTIATFDGMCSADMYPINSKIDTHFLFRWMLTNTFTDWASNAESRTVLPKINQKDLSEIPVPTPPLPEQHEIVRRVEQLFAYADTIEKQVNNALARVNNLTQSILAKAFRGELTAQWRAENPDLISGENSAAALLEKIKAERAASGGKKASRKKS